MNRKQSQADGFSLVEVLIVIVITGIVAGIVAMVIGNVVDNSSKEKARAAATASCQLDQRLYSVAVAAFKVQHKGQWPTSDTDIAPLVKQPSKYWTVTDSGKSIDRVQAKPGVSLPSGCVNDPKT